MSQATRWRTAAIGAVLLAGAVAGTRPAAAQDRGAEEGAAVKKEAPPADEPPRKPEAKQPPENPFPGRVKVPDGIFDDAGKWLNASGDIRLKDLRGKIVVIDFWTYCCINCMHVLPDLHWLEKKYPKELVVVGVHSAKFENEKDTENIRRAIQRYEIEHPVLNDSQMLVWRRFGTRAWPTLAIIDPEGYYIGSESGEGKRELFDLVVGKLVEYHKAKGTLDPTPVRFDLERAKLKPGPLRFPGKILADERSGRLFVSDSNHNRIVVSSLDGKLQATIGDGTAGAADGPFETARFDHPQGLALVGDVLYVADTENHLLRRVDLEARTVSTLAGTGKQDRERTQGGKLRETALNSPWDVLHHDGTLYVAMAGPHQIWKHVVGSETIDAWAGSGREDIVNGTLEEGALAQPSGLATDGTHLFVCDSEGSAVRRIRFKAKADDEDAIGTLVGTSDLPRGASLFEFGDVDGKGNEVRLQHPLGVAFHDGTLYVADTYNHKIRRVRPDGKTWSAETWLGNGKSGSTLDPPQFSEPAGVSVARGRLYVADTNNHRICVADLAAGTVRTLAIEGLAPPVRQPVQVADDVPEPGEEFTGVPVQKVPVGKSVRFEFALDLPEGYKLNDLLPVTAKVQAKEKQTIVAEEILAARIPATVEGGRIVVEVPLAGKPGDADLVLAISYGYCREGTGGLCKFRTDRWRVPLGVAADGSTKVVALPTPQRPVAPKSEPEPSPR